MSEIEKFDLGALAELLAKEHPEITELYLFGSRRYRTRSFRSDIDVLVVCTGFVQPLALRSFIQKHCRALDLFVLKDGKATSCQNESFLDAKDNAALIQRLDAVRFWTRKEGRLRADVDWTVSIRSDYSFKPSALPFSPKSGNLDAGEIPIGVLVRNLKVDLSPENWAKYKLSPEVVQDLTEDSKNGEAEDGRADHRGAEGIGSRDEDVGSVPQARHQRDHVLQVEGQVRRHDGQRSAALAQP